MSEELQASCAVVQCIVGADSNSNDSQALTRSESNPIVHVYLKFGTVSSVVRSVMKNSLQMVKLGSMPMNAVLAS